MRDITLCICKYIFNYIHEHEDYWSRISIFCYLPAVCSLNITEMVSFYIASEASYVYILSGQKLIKNAENGPFWRVFEKLKLEVKQSYQTCPF